MKIQKVEMLVPNLHDQTEIEKVEKLAANLRDQTEYVIHLINLKQA